MPHKRLLPVLKLAELVDGNKRWRGLSLDERGRLVKKLILIKAPDLFESLQWYQPQLRTTRRRPERVFNKTGSVLLKSCALATAKELHMLNEDRMTADPTYELSVIGKQTEMQTVFVTRRIKSDSGEVETVQISKRLCNLPPSFSDDYRPGGYKDPQPNYAQLLDSPKQPDSFIVSSDDDAMEESDDELDDELDDESDDDEDEEGMEDEEGTEEELEEAVGECYSANQLLGNKRKQRPEDDPPPSTRMGIKQLRVECRALSTDTRDSAGKLVPQKTLLAQYIWKTKNQTRK